MQVTTSPYLREQGDVDAVVASLKSMVKAIKKNPLIEFAVPAPGVTIEDYVDSVSYFSSHLKAALLTFSSWTSRHLSVAPTTGWAQPRSELTVV
jgi:hypothetical protein